MWAHTAPEQERRLLCHAFPAFARCLQSSLPPVDGTGRQALRAVSRKKFLHQRIRNIGNDVGERMQAGSGSKRYQQKDQSVFHQVLAGFFMDTAVQE